MVNSGKYRQFHEMSAHGRRCHNRALDCTSSVRKQDRTRFCTHRLGSRHHLTKAMTQQVNFSMHTRTQSFAQYPGSPQHPTRAVTQCAVSSEHSRTGSFAQHLRTRHRHSRAHMLVRLLTCSLRPSSLRSKSTTSAGIFNSWKTAFTCAQKLQ